MVKFFTTLLIGLISGLSISLAAVDLTAARAELYKNYSKIEAHLKFAGILCDAGLYESAFFNAEAARSAASADLFNREFARYARRQLRTYQLSGSKRLPTVSERINQQRTNLARLAVKHPPLARYADFAAANESKWNSTNAADIRRISRGLLDFRNTPEVWEWDIFNQVAARYFHKIADDPEAALYFYLRLYFHDPRMNIGEPVDYCAHRLIMRLNRSLPEVLLLKNRGDIIRTVSNEMNHRPRAVEKLLEFKRLSISVSDERQISLLLLRSVDMRLRSRAIAAMSKQPLPYLRENMQSWLTSSDAAFRALGVSLLHRFAEPAELPELLAEFGADPAEFVELTADAAARKYCDADNLIRYREMIGSKRSQLRRRVK